ncbi:MAG: DUF308 domain-containing protein [Thermoflexaceae bacterium]|nr:DUF308 domain-containing protein [Thermoflexaceae bacterium]
MNVLKEMKKNAMISSLIYVIVGIILTLFPGSTARTIGYAFATVVLIAGLSFLYRFITKDVSYSFVGNEFVIGIVLVMASVFVFMRVDSVVSIIPILLGVVITISGISKLQNAIGLHKMHYSGSTAVLAFAILNIVFGIVLILNPFGAVTTLIMLIGLGLIFSGVTDFVTTFLITRNLMKMKKNSDIIEVEAREIE